MKNIVIVALVAIAAPIVAYAADDTATARVETAAPVRVGEGKMLYTGNGYRLAPVYRINRDGNPQVVVDGRLVTIPASTLSYVGGKLTTSLSIKDITKAS